MWVNTPRSLNASQIAYKERRINLSFHSHPKHILKRWKIYATHKDELSNDEINDYKRIMDTLKKAPKPLLQFIHSFFYEHATVIENNKISQYTALNYTNKLMKYDDYCEMVRISRKEFNRQMTQVCLLMYEHYFEDKYFKKYLRG